MEGNVRVIYFNSQYKTVNKNMTLHILSGLEILETMKLQLKTVKGCITKESDVHFMEIIFL